MSELEARPIRYLDREAVALGNAQVQAVVDAQGGMMPVFGLRRGRGLLNAHWLPPFRAAGAAPPAGLAPYWRADLLRHIAGDFPCGPNFGPAEVVDGVALPPHGWAASAPWRLEGVAAGGGAAWARWSLASPDPRLPLAFGKCDLVLPGQPAYFSVLTVRNGGPAAVEVNLGRHVTLGAPFLAPGCRLASCADRFATPPPGTEFDDTGRLAVGAAFEALSAAPLRAGGVVDLTRVPGPVGASDLVAGAVPPRLPLGWTCVVNPALALAHVAFFPGEAALPAGEIALTFDVLWMQYGGRPFTPWALADGAPDLTFCLGAEHAVSAFASGLGWARAHPTLLGRPTTLRLPPGETRRLCFGAALVALDPALAGEGIVAVEAEPGALVLKGPRAAQRVAVAADLAPARVVAAAAGV